MRGIFFASSIFCRFLPTAQGRWTAKHVTMALAGILSISAILAILSLERVVGRRCCDLIGRHQ